MLHVTKSHWHEEPELYVVTRASDSTWSCMHLLCTEYCQVCAISNHCIALQRSKCVQSLDFVCNFQAQTQLHAAPQIDPRACTCSCIVVPRTSTHSVGKWMSPLELNPQLVTGYKQDSLLPESYKDRVSDLVQEILVGGCGGVRCGCADT
jgi:hypothetical protein